jgi:hypothetical protein
VFKLVRCRKLAAAVAAVAAITAATTAAAQASSAIDTDSVSLGSGSFEFRSGELIWEYRNGEYNAELKGDLKIDNANGSCARMRMEYFDNSQSLIVKYGGTVCADDGGSYTYSVDLNPGAIPGSTC